MSGWLVGTPQGPRYVKPPVPFPRMLGVSSQHAQHLSNNFGCPVRYVHNGIDLPPFDPAMAKSEDFLLSLNRISPEKGIANNIDVALQTGWKMKVVGDDIHPVNFDYINDVQNRCANSGGQVQYYGHVDNETKWDLLRRCKALIACTDNEHYLEAFGIYCLPGDQKVITLDGPKEIQNIQMGDMVLTHKGRYRKVTQTFIRKHTGKIMEIDVYGQDVPLKITPEHPVYSTRRQKKMSYGNRPWAETKAEWKGADTVSKGDCVVFPKIQQELLSTTYDMYDYVRPNSCIICGKCGRKSIQRMSNEQRKNKFVQCSSCYSSKYITFGTFNNAILIENTGRIRLHFDNSTEGMARFVNISNDLAKIIGFYIAEGSTGGNDGFIDMTQNHYPEIIDELGICVQNVFGLKPHISYRNYTRRIIIKGGLITNFINTICGKGAFHKHIPKEILYGEDLTVLRTLVDYMVKGDGSTDQRSIRYTTVSERLAYDLKIALIRLGYKPTINSHIPKGTFKSNGLAYTVMWTIDSSDYRHGNKSWRGRDGMYYLVRNMRDESYDDLVYNLEVEEDNSYTTLGFTVHNCVEANAVGKPVLGTANGGLYDIIKKEPDGSYITNGLLTVNTAGVISAIRNGALDTFKPENCRAQAELYDTGHMTLAYLQLFEKVLRNDVDVLW